MPRKTAPGILHIEPINTWAFGRLKLDGCSEASGIDYDPLQSDCYDFNWSTKRETKGRRLEVSKAPRKKHFQTNEGENTRPNMMTVRNRMLPSQIPSEVPRRISCKSLFCDSFRTSYSESFRISLWGSSSNSFLESPGIKFGRIQGRISENLCSNRRSVQSECPFFVK